MLNLQLKAKEIEITNKHKAFKDTEFAKHEFLVKMQTLSSTQIFSAIQESTVIKNGLEITNNMDLIAEQLALSIKSWDGIYADGEPVECTKENMKALFDYSHSFAASLMKAYEIEVIDKNVKKK